MDSINAAAMTTAQAPVKTTEPRKEKEAEGTPVQDTVEKGADETGFFSKMKNLVSSGVDNKEEAYRSSDVSILEKYRSEAIGGAVGFVAAGITGAVIAHSSAMADVNKLPVESVSLKWKEPIMQQKNLGQMPADYYQPNNVWGWVNNSGKVDVVRDAPALDASGQPVMNPRSHTFTDHGKPVVRWQDMKIQDPQLKGWNESTLPDNERVMVGHHTESVDSGRRDSQNRIIYKDVEVDDYETRTKGWNHSFSADIDYKTVGTYTKPEVTFETGVSVGLRTFVGFLVGAGTGAVGVALATGAAKRALEKMQEKKSASEAKS
jgi:hypothetical protein